MSYIADDELNAIENLSYESKQAYKRFGEDIFGKHNFKGREIINKATEPPENILAFIFTQLRDGILPRDLDEDELVFLEQQEGEKWYEKWGYTESDLKKN